VWARVRSFGHALNGLRVMLAREHNAWIHAAFTVAAVGLAAALGISRLEWCAVVIVIGLVWAAEAFNTALEALADAAVPEQHPGIAVAKDAAAGAVLVCALAAAVVGGIVFAPRLLALLLAPTASGTPGG
jgi:diacylglycerol kinase (ATP)